jgi:hypothetical protein
MNKFENINKHLKMKEEKKKRKKKKEKKERKKNLVRLIATRYFVSNPKYLRCRKKVNVKISKTKMSKT